MYWSVSCLILYVYVFKSKMCMYNYIRRSDELVSPFVPLEIKPSISIEPNCLLLIKQNFIK